MSANTRTWLVSVTISGSRPALRALVRERGFQFVNGDGEVCKPSRLPESDSEIESAWEEWERSASFAPSHDNLHHPEPMDAETVLPLPKPLRLRSFNDRGRVAAKLASILSNDAFSSSVDGVTATAIAYPTKSGRGLPNFSAQPVVVSVDLRASDDIFRTEFGREWR